MSILVSFQRNRKKLSYKYICIALFCIGSLQASEDKHLAGCYIVPDGKNHEQPEHPIKQYTGLNPKRYQNLSENQVACVERFWRLLSDRIDYDKQHMDRTSGILQEWCTYMRAQNSNHGVTCNDVLIHFNGLNSTEEDDVRDQVVTVSTLQPTND